MKKYFTCSVAILWITCQVAAQGVVGIANLPKLTAPSGPFGNIDFLAEPIQQVKFPAQDTPPSFPPTQTRVFVYPTIEIDLSSVTFFNESAVRVYSPTNQKKVYFHCTVFLRSGVGGLMTRYRILQALTNTPIPNGKYFSYLHSKSAAWDDLGVSVDEVWPNATPMPQPPVPFQAASAYLFSLDWFSRSLSYQDLPIRGLTIDFYLGAKKINIVAYETSAISPYSNTYSIDYETDKVNEIIMLMNGQFSVEVTGVATLSNSQQINVTSSLSSFSEKYSSHIYNEMRTQSSTGRGFLSLSSSSDAIKRTISDEGQQSSTTKEILRESIVMRNMNDKFILSRMEKFLLGDEITRESVIQAHQLAAEAAKAAGQTDLFTAHDAYAKAMASVDGKVPTGVDLEKALSAYANGNYVEFLAKGVGFIESDGSNKLTFRRLRQTSWSTQETNEFNALILNDAEAPFALRSGSFQGIARLLGKQSEMNANLPATDLPYSASTGETAQEYVAKFNAAH